MIIVIGKGHSGTRLIGQTLHDSGVNLGKINEAFDTVTQFARPIYRACREIGSHVDYLGNNEWDFKRVWDNPPTDDFITLIKHYIGDIQGFKIPEATLCYPWLIKMYEDAKFIYWVRDPRDVIGREYCIFNDKDFGVPWEYHNYRGDNNLSYRLAVSCKYYDDIVIKTEKPKNFHIVYFEDFVLNQDRELKKLSQFLKMNLKRVPVDITKVNVFRKYEGHDFMNHVFKSVMENHGYS